jgi:hypothetical protein
LNPVREFEGNSEKKKSFPPERERERESMHQIYLVLFFIFFGGNNFFI